MKKAMTMQAVQQVTANEFVNVKDIKDNFLYSKAGYLFGYLRVFPYNLDLLSKEERELNTQTLSSSYDGDRKSFDYLSFPREIDLDGYKNALKERYQAELNSLSKRQLLTIMMQVAQKLSTSGENFEHQHFIKLWQKIGNHEPEARHDLFVRLEEFKNRYAAVGIITEILSEQEIIKLCNLFGNSQQTSFEVVDDNLLYANIPQIR